MLLLHHSIFSSFLLQPTRLSFAILRATTVGLSTDNVEACARYSFQFQANCKCSPKCKMKLLAGLRVHSSLYHN